MQKLVVLLLLIGCTTLMNGQGTSLPLWNEAYHIIDRLEIKTGISNPIHSALKYYNRSAVTQYALQIDTASIALSSKDRRDLYYIFKDNNEWLVSSKYATTLGGQREKINPDQEWTQVEASMDNARYTLSKKPFLKYFYQSPANFFELNKKFVHLRINPILNFSLGTENDEKQPIFSNRRGFELRGGIDDRIFFYTNIVESQSKFPDYVNEYTINRRSLPSEGFFKPYTSAIFNIENGYDYLNSQGYLGFNVTRHVGMQFGYGRHFIGDGFRSMLLSDFANNYLYLKLNWNIWKLHFQNIFAELSIYSGDRVLDGTLVPKKYMAAHYVSFNLNKNLTFGFFETVIFTRPNQFEFQYLNPVILYRTIEQAVGSSDNVLLGFTAKWNFLNRFQLYSQLMMDEFVFKELFLEPNGWWANKFGFQAGLKYIDAFAVDHLDLQVEFNAARPYTYTFRDTSAVYSHYDQQLAHPIGANFRELIFKLRYVPTPKLLVEAKLIRTSYGAHRDGINYGNNIFIPNRILPMVYGNEITQGALTKINLLGIDLSYQLRHNVYLDLRYLYRNRESELESLIDKTSIIQAGVRVNIGKQQFDF